MVSSSNKAMGEESSPTLTSLLSRGRVFSCRHCSRQFSTLQGLGGHKNAHNYKKKPIPMPTPTSTTTLFSSIFAHHHNKKWRRIEPRPPISISSMHGLSSTTDLHHSSLSPPLNTNPQHSSAQLGLLQYPVSTSLFGGRQSCGDKSGGKEAVFQPNAHNGGGNNAELKEIVLQPIAHNGSGYNTEFKEAVLQPIAHNGGRNNAELKQAILQPIAHNGGGSKTELKEAVFQPIAHNGPSTVTMFGEGDPCSLESAGQKEGTSYSFESGGRKEVGELEGGSYSLEPPCGEMSFQSSCVTTVMIEEDEEELDLSLHL